MMSRRVALVFGTWCGWPRRAWPDGHPKLGSFLGNSLCAPHVGWWLVKFYEDFKIGDHVKRHNQIDDITFKSGKWKLLFVAITHEFSVDGAKTT